MTDEHNSLLHVVHRNRDQIEPIQYLQMMLPEELPLQTMMPKELPEQVSDQAPQNLVSQQEELVEGRVWA